MERREFAQTIGQKLIDPREAIIELHKEGTSIQAIADILGVDRQRTVSRILAEEGLIEWTATTAQRAIERGHDAPDPSQASGSTGDTGSQASGDPDPTDQLKAEIADLSTQLKGKDAIRKREADEAKEKLAELRKAITVVAVLGERGPTGLPALAEGGSVIPLLQCSIGCP